MADVRGARLRWTRHRALVVGAVSLAAAGVGVGLVGALGGSQQSDEPSAPPPTSSAPPPAARTSDLAGTDDGWFRLTENDGCRSCTVVWRRSGDAGDWERLFEISGKESYGGRVTTDFGPVSSLVLTPDGRDGWAWYKTLWSTHDGGRSWSHVIDGPGGRTLSGHKVVLTDRYAWSLRNGELWRTPLDRDAWSRVVAPGLSGAVDLLALPGQVLVQEYDEGLANPRLIGSRDGSAWSELSMPCQGETRPTAAGDAVFVACSQGKREVVVQRSVGLGSWQEFGTVVARQVPDLVPLAGDRVVAFGRSAAVLLTPNGSEQADVGPRRPGSIYGSETRGAVSYLIARAGLFESNDDGSTWLTTG